MLLTFPAKPTGCPVRISAKVEEKLFYIVLLSVRHRDSSIYYSKVRKSCRRNEKRLQILY